jgi:hypothetical protein
LKTLSCEISVEVLHDEALAAVGFESITKIEEVAASLRPRLIVADPAWKSYLSIDADVRQDIAKLAAIAPTMLLVDRFWTAIATAGDLGVASALQKPLELGDFLREVWHCLAGAAERPPSLTENDGAPATAETQPRDTGSTTPG